MTTTEEKDQVARIEDASEAASEDDEILSRFTAKEQRRIRHRIDWRLLPSLSLMYGISLMDRANISNAAIAGMREDLNLLSGYRYSLITLTFFITYILFQPPATVACRKIGPKIFLPGICLFWGALIIGFGFANNWQTLMGLRLVLGLLEAGFFPGCVFMLSTWYTRFEVAKRYSVFYLIGSLASALSGILAYGLMQLDGVASIEGWRWIFILEGIITCAVACFGYFMIIRFPDEEQTKPSRRFLSGEQCDFIIHKLNKDRADVAVEPFSLAKFMRPALKIEVWAFATIFLCVATVTYSFSFFLPIILKDNLGYSTAASQCLIAPPYLTAGLLMQATSWAGDKWKVRAPIMVFNSLVSLIGLPIMGFHGNSGVRYFGVFLAVAGMNANVPAIMAYQANNIRGQWMRAFCSASLTGFGGIGGIAGSLVFRTQDRPDYTPGVIATIVANVLIIVICGLLSILFRRRNAKADRGELVINDSVDFRYTL